MGFLCRVWCFGFHVSRMLWSFRAHLLFGVLLKVGGFEGLGWFLCTEFGGLVGFGGLELKADLQRLFVR